MIVMLYTIFIITSRGCISSYCMQERFRQKSLSPRQGIKVKVSSKWLWQNLGIQRPVSRLDQTVLLVNVVVVVVGEVAADILPTGSVGGLLQQHCPGSGRTVQRVLLLALEVCFLSNWGRIPSFPKDSSIDDQLESYFISRFFSRNWMSLFVSGNAMIVTATESQHNWQSGT